MHKYKDLNIWQFSMDLTSTIYSITQAFPDEEKFGLKSQMRRCAVSIPSNIAEGAGRNGKAEFKQFIGIALGSLFELDTQVELSYKFKYISESDFSTIMSEIVKIRKMMFSFQNTISK
ncbi:four helix bundle protein [Marivirga sp.]|uniref:four helix bundle protein n=1 Tax=Marivirga sp. TaxID=2018662 RepID=UPI002D7F0394|nr:four helix bundle protein [Marivirga sp.]HET8859883.1 four helix bundle protein [Marivirga sp.]